MPWFDCAIRRPIGANTGGIISTNLGLVLHHAVANGSLWSFFNNPSAQVSAHFWVSKTGVIEQYVDTSVVAWHGRDLNSRYVGVETEGCTQGPAYAEPMPDAMRDGLARIYAEGNRRHGWPNALASANGQPGFGFHRMAVNTACPCDVRLHKRQEILNIAFGGPITPPTPEPPPKKEDEDMLLAPAFKFNGMLHAFYVTKSHGELWHKWSSNNGLNWHSENLMGAGPDKPGYVRTPRLIEVSAPVPDDQVCTVLVYDETNFVWMCRQEKGQTTWDRRRL